MKPHASVLWSVVICASALPACASYHAQHPSTTPDSAPSFAVYPQLWMTLSPSIDVDAAGVFAQELRQAGFDNVFGPDQTAQSSDQDLFQCAEDPECLHDLGENLGVNYLLILRLAELGETVILRLSLTDIDSGARSETRQEVLSNVTNETVIERIRAFAAEFQARYFPDNGEDRVGPWYRRWWFWTIVGGVAVGSSVGIGLGLGLRDDPGQTPDVVITPP